tara:strand:+ start:429 stop:950 length:522 start_codon:yes stop_codon:yes gene_type:complete
MAEIEYGGIKLGGSKLLLLIPLLTTLGGVLWGGFEFYKDYSNMKTKIEKYVAPDLSGINAKLGLTEQSLSDAIDYSRDIKNGLRDDIVRLERIIDKMEDDVNGVEAKTRQLLDDAEKRFETKRDELRNQYTAQKDMLIRENTANKELLESKVNQLKSDMEKKLQRALDNPLAK